MRRWVPLLLMAIVLPMTPAKAQALSTSDIIALTRAGLGDEVLLALIEMEGRVFTIDTPVLSRLKEAGVSERVIVAMIKSGRTPPADVPAPQPWVTETDPPEPQVIVIEHDRQPSVVQQVVVPMAVPVYVPHLRRAARKHVTHPTTPDIRSLSGFGVPLPVRADPPPAKSAEPVYWGWGGKRRPDAWKD